MYVIWMFINSNLNKNNSKVIGHNLFKGTFIVENSDKTTATIGLDEYESNK